MTDNKTKVIFNAREIYKQIMDELHPIELGKLFAKEISSQLKPLVLSQTLDDTLVNIANDFAHVELKKGVSLAEQLDNILARFVNWANDNDVGIEWD